MWGEKSSMSVNSYSLYFLSILPSTRTQEPPIFLGIPLLLASLILSETSLDFNYVKPFFDLFQFSYNFMRKGIFDLNLDIKSAPQLKPLEINV